MENNFTLLINESLNLELNVYNLYFLFYTLCKDDSDFWWKLTLEEKNHAALIKSGIEYFEPKQKFPHNLLADSLISLKNINAKIKNLLIKYNKKAPSREEALSIALKIENSAGELDLQKFMDKESNSKIDDIFKQLNMYDKDHAQKIASYMEKHGIKLQSDN